MSAAIPITIEPANVHCQESVSLLERLTAELAQRYHDDGVGDFQASDLDQPRSGFLVGRVDGQAIACGAFRPLDGDIAEIKRMYVVPAFRRHGFGRLMMEALENHACAAEYARIRLETGTGQPEAVQLYESAGYKRIRPYGFYQYDPRSLCFEKVLSSNGNAAASSNCGSGHTDAI